MSLKHVKEYFVDVEKQYTEMLRTLKEIDPLLKQGLVPQEMYENVQSDVLRLKDNYERVAYIMFLFNQPNKKSRRINKRDKSWINRLQHSSKETIIKENDDVLKHFKELLEIKEVGDKDE